MDPEQSTGDAEDRVHRSADGRVEFLNGVEHLEVQRMGIDDVHGADCGNKRRSRSRINTVGLRHGPMVSYVYEREILMPTVITEDVHIEIPEWVNSLAAFRRWADDEDFPDKGNIWWLRGKVWADMSQEQLYSHNLVRTEITSVLHFVKKKDKSGLLFSDGVRVTNVEVGISGKPDLTYVSFESFAEGRVIRIEGKSEGYVELEGSPDMLLEVVSKSSVVKDLETLREDYYQAGVSEYWIVDARRSPASLDILKRGPKGFVPTRKQGGWVKSNVFGRSFRLTVTTDKNGDPEYTLEVK